MRASLYIFAPFEIRALEWRAKAELLDCRKCFRHSCNAVVSEKRVRFKVPQKNLIMRFDSQDFKQSWENNRDPMEFRGSLMVDSRRSGDLQRARSWYDRR